MDVNRRNLLKGAVAGAAGTALTGGLLAAGARHDAQAAAQLQPTSPDLVPFHGVRQAGLVTPTPAQRYSTHVALDATTANRAELVTLFHTITDRARFLTAGGTPPDLGVGSPPSDSAVLGPVVPSDGLSVTLSVGSSLFDSRYGLATRQPPGLVAMRSFPNDSLEPANCHGDLFLQVCANNPDTVHHALRDITKHTRGGMQIRYRLDGFGSPPRPAGVSRNLLGFKDGISQPPPGDNNQLVWIQPGAGNPDWAVGGTYHVVRFIRMLVEFWDRVDINEQETMFGRRRDSGAPLDGAAESDVPNYAADPKGEVVPLTAHMRLANPRTPDTANSRILRRPYNYDNGVDRNGNLEVGLIFVSFQQDIARQFEATQTRLVDEPLV
ncbi:MAG TPA: Dyp-type peroxidase, partial [Pseudonocardia sp.]|nr:Dyp-type peroxidase [Pseudonocardia sp.]